MVCPLCEHEQEEGDSCEQCGRPWAQQSPSAVAEVPLAGLELTQMASPAQIPILPLLHLDRGREEVPPVQVSPPEPGKTEPTNEEELRPRCPNCGLMGSSSGRCFACGVRLA